MIGNTHYLRVNREKISICLDSDVDYFHHYKIGDTIELEIGKNLELILKPFNIEDPKFHLDWDETKSARVSVSKLLEIGHLIDVTIMVRREKLIDIIL